MRSTNFLGVIFAAGVITFAVFLAAANVTECARALARPPVPPVIESPAETERVVTARPLAVDGSSGAPYPSTSAPHPWPGGSQAIHSRGVLACEQALEVPAPAPYTHHPYPYDAPDQAERTLIAAADADCVNKYGTRQAHPGVLDPFLALHLLRLEQDMGVPLQVRGITLATWCREASYQLGATNGDEGHAIGPFQLHDIFERKCERRISVPGQLRVITGSRPDLLWTAACYLTRIKAKLPNRCADPWLAAEAWTASWPRYYPNCTTSQHGDILLRWRDS